MCENYYFRGKAVSTYESGVLEMVEREANANLEEYKEIVDQVWRLSDPTNSPDIAKTKEDAKRIKAEFKEVMMKVAIDQKITLSQLRRLTTQQYQMFVAFCNCKFSLTLQIDAGAGYEQVLQQVNQNIEDVVQRAVNLRKNEEFLKKKWKEFLKFLKALAKQQGGKPVHPVCPSKADISRLMYEKFHRSLVLEKIRLYAGDVKRYRLEEWGTTAEHSEEAFVDNQFECYDRVENKFIMQYFSVKA